MNPHVPGGTKGLAQYCLLGLLTGHALSREYKQTWIWGIVFVHNYQRGYGRLFHMSASQTESCNGNKNELILKAFSYRKI